MVMVETMLALPLVVIFVCLWIQVLWLFWASQTLAVASSYALRAGALGQGAKAPIERTLAAGMAIIEPTALGRVNRQQDRQPTLTDYQQAHLLTAATQQLHFKWAGRLQIHHASPQQFRQFGVQRKVAGELHWVMPNDHLPARAQQIEAAQQTEWLAAQQLGLEVWWCFPLRIPLAATLFNQVARLSSSPAQQFCNRRGQVAGTHLWALSQHVQGPMLSDLVGPKVTVL